MIASSSFTELRISKPPNFHSPLSPVKIEDVRIQPWIEAASAFINLTVFYTTENQNHPILIT